MKNSVLGAVVVVAATVFGAGSALAVYNTNSTSTGSSTVVAASGPSTVNVITGGTFSTSGGGVTGSWTKTGALPGSTQTAKRAGGAGFADSGTGASAGNGEQRFGVWSNFAGTGFNEDQSAIQSSGQIYTFMLGGDYKFNNWVIAGLSAGYERQSIDTQFNNGTWDANGAVVSPYVVVQLIPKQLFFSGSVGYVGNSIDLTRNNGAITGDTSGNRYFTSGTLMGNLDYGKFNIRPQIGAMYMKQDIDGYTETGTGATTAPETTVHFGRFTVGSQVGYNIGNVQPYALAAYQYDFKYDVPTVGAGQVQPTAYKNSALVGGGLLFVLSQRFSGGLQFASEVGKTDYISYTGQGTIRYEF